MKFSSLIFCLVPLHVSADNWSIHYDDVLDGVVNGDAEYNTDVTVRQMTFASTENDVFVGQYLNDGKIIEFNQTSESIKQYYLGKKGESGYAGTWYNTAGQSGDWSIRTDTDNTVIKKTCWHILDSGNSVGDGYYMIDPDGENNGVEPFEVYCDMTNQGGGWTLFAHNKDNILTKEFVETVSPNQLGVMRNLRWNALLSASHYGLMTLDQAGKKAMVTFETMNQVNPENRVESLAPDLSKAHLLWHAKSSSAGINDFTAIVMYSKDSGEGLFNKSQLNGASVYNHGYIKFDVWDYAPGRYYQGHVWDRINSLLYYIK
ncbi:fibrinogen-like YCDxxxxGGGW domain-containing protein [Photobacterium galatheae]|uniref:fibrinogen-like YCDxxxxGGGW domain-containing protein n=1 Tax=Photobacterium galatheae TaxID=1654360 RepID=UPI00137706FD|nr:fibrinogen-like YCDxxxxGGGW domain-containing protein [Photobacterium galatheae]MCM0149697.1 hypothetical protein [Photobacterium galatheae]